MKTIRTILLIFTLLCGIVPAMAEVNFTEKTEFLYPTYIDGKEAASMYLTTDNNGITLSSSKNELTVLSKQSGENFFRYYDKSC